MNLTQNDPKWPGFSSSRLAGAAAAFGSALGSGPDVAATEWAFGSALVSGPGVAATEPTPDMSPELRVARSREGEDASKETATN